MSVSPNNTSIRFTPANAGGRNPASPPAKKYCSHCQRDKPADDFGKPGTDEILKTCYGCRQGRAKSRVREGGRRKRISVPSETTRRLRRSTALHPSSPSPVNASASSASGPATPSSTVPAAVTELEAFGTSLGRLSHLLKIACETLPQERVIALGGEINHDWRVDEMATFVEGFLKGAAGGGQARGW